MFERKSPNKPERPTKPDRYDSYESLIPEQLKSEPWPPESEMQRPLGDFASPKQRNINPDDEPQEELVKKLGKIILEKKLDRIADLFVELTFGEMIELAEEIGSLNPKMPNPMELAPILHRWGVQRQKKEPFKKQEYDDTNPNVTSTNGGPKNGRKPKPTALYEKVPDGNEDSSPQGT